MYMFYLVRDGDAIFRAANCTMSPRKIHHWNCHQLVSWCSWLSLLSNTQAVPGSSPGEINLLQFLFLGCV